MSRHWRWRNEEASELPHASGRKGQPVADQKAVQSGARSYADNVEVGRPIDMDDRTDYRPSSVPEADASRPKSRLAQGVCTCYHLSFEGSRSRFFKELRIHCRGSASRTRQYIFSVSLLAVKCARMLAPVELEAPIMACYPRVHEQALSPRQQAEHLSGPDTRAIQNYFRIP